MLVGFINIYKQFLVAKENHLRLLFEIRCQSLAENFFFRCELSNAIYGVDRERKFAR